jgi:lipoprotein-releasing system ATP-binding protein
MLKAEQIKKKYGELTVLKGVDIEIRKGEIVSIVGSSGAGKSTLLHILGTLDKADSGAIWLHNEAHRPTARKKARRFPQQAHRFCVPVPSPAARIYRAGKCLHSRMDRGPEKKEATARAIELLTTLGLADRIDNKPQQLSGGEQQRVAVARALINNPSIVFADEPTGNLDSTNARDLHDLFVRLRDDFNQTFLIVTHNEELAGMSDRTLHMKDGMIVSIYWWYS